MGAITNRWVSRVLRSPAHGLLSGTTAVVRYRTARSGDLVELPVRYVVDCQDLVVLVGQAEQKRWWRDFLEQRQADVLVKGQWTVMNGRVLLGSGEDFHEARRVLARYLAVRPRGARSLNGADLDARTSGATLMCLRPTAPRRTSLTPASGRGSVPSEGPALRRPQGRGSPAALL